MTVLRSMLFVPGDSEKKMAKGGSIGADALILDLEDSVAASRRPLAREMVHDYLKNAGRAGGELWVRINPLDTTDALRDVAAVARARPDGIALPKCNGPEDVVQLSHYLDALEIEHGIPQGSIAICAIATETAAAPFSLGQYKGAPRLRVLTWGAEDLAAALGASSNKDAAGNYTAPYVLARSLCLFGAYAAGVQGLDTVQPDFRNAAKLREECNDARRDGFLGKIAIHPDQVPVINECFTPSEAEIAHAQAVIDAFAANPGAGTLSLEGKMIDMPHLKQAERLMSIVRRTQPPSRGQRPMQTSWQARKKYIEVHGQRMAYVEQGQGSPIVFQHGNPTSSWLWRNILPQLADVGRCIALDLVGMGDSAKLPDPGPTRYTLAEHQRYFDGALAALGVTERVTLVLHDWGTALGFDWASRHPDKVSGLCHMEGLVTELTWADWPEEARGIFQAFRSPAGEELVLQKNVFVERVLPKSILRALDATEMDAYRAPFVSPGEDRRPTLSWPRQLPIEGEPPEVCATVARYGRWLAASETPKLFVNGEPGMIMTGRAREIARAFHNQREVTVKGLHFLQEDSPDEIAAAIRDWLPTLAR